jgi:hypothetical protein
MATNASSVPTTGLRDDAVPPLGEDPADAADEQALEGGVAQDQGRVGGLLERDDQPEHEPDDQAGDRQAGGHEPRERRAEEQRPEGDAVFSRRRRRSCRPACAPVAGGAEYIEFSSSALAVGTEL